jgi:hypothetical protein
MPREKLFDKDPIDSLSAYAVSVRAARLVDEDEGKELLL